MKHLHIAPNLSLPLEAVTQTFAILGIRGSGKTNTGVVLTEELLKKQQQVVVIDPVDVWWGLKSSQDGKEPGFSIPVMGGEHGDVPLEASSGAVVADFLVDTGSPAVLSLRHLSMNDQRRFAADFAKRLYDRKGAEKSPLHLVVDEADEFVPQRIPHGHEGLFGAFDRIVRRGRTSGLGVTLISQRAQVLNKDVLSQCETLVAMRVLHKLDRKAMEAWIEAHDTEGHQEEFMASLASLGRGDAWIWSPSWLSIFQRVHFRARETFDSSATPGAGGAIAQPKRVADVDLEKLKAAMAATIEKAKADDPRELRRQIAELKKDLRGVSGSKDNPLPLIRAEREGYEDGYREGYKEGYKVGVTLEYRRFLVAAKDAISQIEEPTGENLKPTQIRAPGRRQVLASLQTKIKPSPPIQRHPVKPSPPIARGNSVAGAEQRILDALAELEILGVQEPERVQVAFLAGYTNLNSKGFANAIGSLRTAGHIWYPTQGRIALNQSGRSLANYTSAPRTSEELQERVIQMLGGANGRIVKVLVDAHPDSVPREELAARCNYTNLNSKGFANAIGRLRSLGFIDYPERGLIRANDVLFLKTAQSA